MKDGPMSTPSLDDLVAKDLGTKDLVILRQSVLIAELQAELTAARVLLANRVGEIDGAARAEKKEAGT
jgi:hypothetical protein